MRTRARGWRVVILIAAAGCSGCQVQHFGTDPSSSTGSTLWVAPASATGQPAADASTVYFGTTDHQVFAVDRQRGTVRWRVATEARTPRTLNGLNVVLASGRVLFGDYVIYAFDAATGARRWVFDPERQGLPGYAAGAYELTSDGTTVFAGSGSGHVYAIDVATGKPVWVTPITVDGHTSVFDPVLDSGTVYVTVRHFTNPITGEVVAVDRATGAIKWSHGFVPPNPQTGSGPLERVVVVGNLVLASVDDGRIYALDRATGAEQWATQRLAGVLGFDDSRPILLAGNILVAGSATMLVTAYDAATGRLLWQANGGQGASANPLASDGRTVYVPYNNGALGAFDVQTGTQRWIRSAPSRGSFRPYPVVGDEAVFAPSSVGLVALTK